MTQTNDGGATDLTTDGRRALVFWAKWKSWIFQAIEMAPAH